MNRPATALAARHRERIRSVLLSHGFTLKPGCEDLKPYVYEAAEALLALANPWKEAVIDALACAHILQQEHEHDPRKALADLLAWEVQIALDPLVSSEAQALLDAGREKLAEALHYPECWDTAAYPTAESAVREVAASFRCTNDDTHPIAAEPSRCRECGGDMAPGVAMAQTVDCTDEGTCSPGGPGGLIGCLKCKACGWSITSGGRHA